VPYREGDQNDPDVRNAFEKVATRLQYLAEQVARYEASTRYDWDDAPEVRNFFGRTSELHELRQWIDDPTCRLIVIEGIGGIGKTTLALKLAEQLGEVGVFEKIIWRSVQHVPRIDDLLSDCVISLSGNKLAQQDVPDDTDKKITMVLDYLRQRRCLFILDGIEAILDEGKRVGSYRRGYAKYGTLFRRITEGKPHQSVMLLTGRERPRHLDRLDDAVRFYSLQGLDIEASADILRSKGLTEQSIFTELATKYAGNPLALKLVAGHMHVLSTETGDLERISLETIPSGVNDLLAEQFERLSVQEQDIVYWLAIEREPIDPDTLSEMIISLPWRQDVLESLKDLRYRSFIERRGAEFTLQNVVMQYVMQRFTEHVCREIKDGAPILLHSHALLKARTKEYIRTIQMRSILDDILQQLKLHFGSKTNVANQMRTMLEHLRHSSPADVNSSTYAAGNLLNLLLRFGELIHHYDCSHLALRQAYLVDQNLHQLNVAHAHIEDSLFLSTFGRVLSVAFSADGYYLAAGTANGDVRIWKFDNFPFTFKEVQTLKEPGWVRAIAFSPDQGSDLLASGSEDHTIRVWHWPSGAVIHIFSGHHRPIRALTFHPQGHMLVSCSEDGSIRVWDLQQGVPVYMFEEYKHPVRSVSFHPDGHLLAVGGDDNKIDLKDTNSWRSIATLEGHTERVMSVRFSPDGHLLASGSYDHTVRLWSVSERRNVAILQGHTDRVRAVAFSSDSARVSSGGEDLVIRVWDVRSYKGIQMLRGFSNTIRSIAFHPYNSHILVVGSEDRTVRVWDVQSGDCLYKAQGYTHQVWSLAFHPNNATFASGGSDHAIHLWNSHSGKREKTLTGHTDWVRAIAFSADGRTLMSGSGDRTVRVCRLQNNHHQSILQGHRSSIYTVGISPDEHTAASAGDDGKIQLWDTHLWKKKEPALEDSFDRVWSLTFSPDGNLLATGSDDGIVRLWNLKTNQLVRRLFGHTDQVWSVSFNPDGTTLASGSSDWTVCIWNIQTDEVITVLKEHRDIVLAVTFSSDNQWLATSGGDLGILLWDWKKRIVVSRLEGHQAWIRSLAFSPDSSLLISSDEHGIIKVWDVHSGECLHTLLAPRPYEGMNITGVAGLTDAEKESLKALGAVDESE
jgi:WD40 repeat protein